MSEPSEWAKAKAIGAVYSAAPCNFAPPCVDRRDEWCDTCLSNDAICYSVARALDAARAEERESCARVAETVYRDGDVPREMSNLDGYSGFCEGIHRSAAAIRARGDA